MEYSTYLLTSHLRQGLIPNLYTILLEELNRKLRVYGDKYLSTYGGNRITEVIYDTFDHYIHGL